MKKNQKSVGFNGKLKIHRRSFRVQRVSEEEEKLALASLSQPNSTVDGLCFKGLV